ncbi:MAG: hypothetical protein WCP85_10835 [Mariniphaga sp.]
MKTLKTTFRAMAIAIALVGFGNGAMAQVGIVIDDGSTAILNSSGTYTNAIGSTTQTSSSTAILKIGGTAARNIKLTGTMSDYYGGIDFYDGSMLTIPGGGTIGANRIAVSGSTGQVAFVILGSGATTIRGKAGADVINMGQKYGIFASQGDLTITNGNIYFGAYSEATNPSSIGFPISTTAQKSIVLAGDGSKIYTNDATLGHEGRVDVSKSFQFDMTDATTGTAGGASSFVVAKTKVVTDLTGTPALTNNDDGLWTNPDVTSVANGSDFDLTLTATFDPIFQLAVDDSYKGWTGLLSDVSTNPGQSAKLLKDLNNLLSGKTFTNDYAIDLVNKSITDNTNSISIDSDKTLTLGSTGIGKFSGNISFVGTGSTLKVTKAGLLGNNFTINSGSSSGVIELNGVTDAINIINTNFNGKLGTVKVTNGSVITITKSGAI